MAAKRPGLDRPGWAQQQAPPPPGKEHPGTCGGGRHRTGTSGAEQAAGARGNLSSGHEDEAKEMQQSRVEDEDGEKRRRQDEDKTKVTQ